MPSNIPTPVIDLKAFVPAEDFALSRQFYAELGFHTQWAEGESASSARLPSGIFDSHRQPHSPAIAG